MNDFLETVSVTYHYFFSTNNMFEVISYITENRYL
jgi:hypothetical protein